MATGGRQCIEFASLGEELEYNGKLFKEIINIFVKCMPAVLLMDYTCINNLLDDAAMQKVKKKDETEGQFASARLLLEYLKMKPRFFDALMEAMDIVELKLQELKPDFQKKKDYVDKKWLELHPQGKSDISDGNTSMVTDTSSLPTQASSAAQPSSGGALVNDFELTVPMQVINSEEGLQIDCGNQGDQPGNHHQSETVLFTQDNKPTPPVTGDQYTDAMSAFASSDSTYAKLTSAQENETPYDQLSKISLQIDASPMPEQVSEVPEQEVGQEAEPRLPPPVAQHRRQRPRNREDHPSLRVAISNDTRKDFEVNEVTQALRGLPGWIELQEEHEVLQLIRPQRNCDGLYVLWYWALAKRPTICVVLNGKVTTFVIHKSAAQTPVRFYVNRRQKRCSGLRELVQYHIDNGIQYTPRESLEIVVRLTNPAQ